MFTVCAILVVFLGNICTIICHSMSVHSEAEHHYFIDQTSPEAAWTIQKKKQHILQREYANPKYNA